jgi:hypothetical protein
LKIVIDRLLEMRGDDEEIQQLHALWMAAVQATGTELSDAGEGPVHGL